jgi:integrase/recombinase XerD
MKVYDYNLIKKFKIPAKQVTTLDKNGLQRLINSMREDNISRLRLKTAIICLISCGCRVSELIKLNISDVDLESGTAQVIAKGGKMHTLIFNELAIAYIEKYLAMRAEQNQIEGCDALFTTVNLKVPNRWSVNDFERALRNHGKRAGFAISIHPHLLRRSSASLLFHQNASLSVVQRFLGHATPSVTERYYLGNTSFLEVERVHKEIMNDFNINSDSRIGGEEL